MEDKGKHMFIKHLSLGSSDVRTLRRMTLDLAMRFFLVISDMTVSVEWMPD